LYDAGINLGIGFQLKDDLMDVYADKKKFGKQVGGDIIANKKTFLLIKALEKARGKSKAELQRWLSANKFDKRKKVVAVSNLYNRLGVPALTEKKINEFFEKGFDGLNKLSVGKKADTLINFAKSLVLRQK
jgi:geranylgeranyl diphosphate synthase, type II